MNAICSVIAALSVLLTAADAVAQANYPDRPVRLIVGFTPGSATDVAARMFAHKLNEAWGVPVTVENIPGAGGAVGADRVMRATPDGTTLLFGANGALTISPSLSSKITYDPTRDFAPIMLVLRMASVIAVNNDLPVKTFPELVALARAQPGKLSFAHPGVGTPQHVAGELLRAMAGIDIVHVPYRGAVLTDVIGGRVPIAITNVGAILPLLREGKLRGLAVTSLQRAASTPELPTVAESGFAGFEATSWFALLAPAGTPDPIVRKVQETALKIVRDPDTRAKFELLGMDAVESSPEQLAAVLKSDIAKWAKVIKDAGINAAE